MTRADCWHCQLRALVVTWRPSAKYEGAVIGYVHRAKVCGVFPRATDCWEGKVWLVIDERLPVEPFRFQADAERWCTETVQRWFGQLDHK